MIEVVAIGNDLARPFVEGACQRYGMPYDAESGHGMIWWASVARGGLRAVLGWADTLPALVIVGPFGDGSHIEDGWMNELLRAMQGCAVAYVVIPASPSLYIRRQSVQLERYGTCRTPQYERAG